ncbi:tripartite tricarboxylate transporter substrate-binding protein [Falsiroseomonas stagni]|uniref:Tripartite-type tricarboxylate transporter, receptor component TctC n=1 Tax=Falsiroseomonas stagni DSM 19981 TaxID=1123062 RepID=A0A1I4BVI7_9PROT|nr:tripartite tricarboxylate transporter substrate-binding protein [Falsiroseomonas stagni]SFK72808.1 Tripartite-type tricarboxylate transporter, receptor component TctC [Falsiroseomonas stagni DSM 19981]
MTVTRRAVLGTLLATPALAQTGFPSRAITITVPFAAGGPTDVISRLVAEGMAKDLGQPVVVENTTGAGGTIAAAKVAQARPDGHALLMHHIGHAASATLYRRLPYSVTEGFAPLGIATDAAMTLIARPDFPANDLAGLIAAIREQGDRLNLAHSGLGGANQLCGMLLQAAAGRAMTSVVFRGSAPAITELMAGRIDVFCDQATNTAPFIRDGRVKAYAVTLPNRVQGLDLPTTAEAGQPSIAMSTWHGLYAPAATPAPIQQRLSAALRAALKEERLLARLADLVTVAASEDRATPEYHRRFLAEEVARWRPIIQAAGEYAD